LKKFGIIITSTLVFGFFVAATVYLNILNYAHTPAGTEPVEKVMVVKSGQGFKSFSKMLRERGIIEHPAKFRLFARFKGYDKKIKAGEYGLSSAMTPNKILEIMVQ